MWLYKRIYHVLKNEFASIGTRKMSENGSDSRYFI